MYLNENKSVDIRVAYQTTDCKLYRNVLVETFPFTAVDN